MTRILSDRIARLDGCAGRWILDLRDSDQRGYDLNPIPGYVCHVGTISSTDEALAYCATNLWRNARLLFVSDHLNDDASWPGGYDAPSIYRSNARVFRAEFAHELENADGDADGIALDIRYVTPEMIETIEALQDYPLISEDDHSELEVELQDEAWEQWAATDWRRAVEAKIAEHCPDAVDDVDSWVESLSERITDETLSELFSSCCDQTSTYWVEESSGSQWIDLDRAAKAIDRYAIEDLTGLTLLAPDQEWRREPYPWTGAEPAPLLPQLPTIV